MPQLAREASAAGVGTLFVKAAELGPATWRALLRVRPREPSWAKGPAGQRPRIAC